MQCQRCGLDPACVSVTEVHPDGATATYICKRCARREGVFPAPTISDFLLGRLRQGDGNARRWAAEQLTKITGQEYCEDCSWWERWLQMHRALTEKIQKRWECFLALFDAPLDDTPPPDELLFPVILPGPELRMWEIIAGE